MSTFILTFFSLVVVINSLTAPSTLSQSDKQALLDKHNYYRNLTALGYGDEPAATNMNKLFWDFALEDVAKNWAEWLCLQNSGNLKHNDNRHASFESSTMKTFYTNTYSTGENIGKYWTSTNVYTMDDVLNRITAWFNEVDTWDYNTTYGAAGHYTQVVWAKTRYVGCGVYIGSNQDCGAMLVCNYFPRGNTGSYPYEKALTTDNITSNCDSDRTQKEDGLCGGCLNTHYHVQDVANGDEDCDNFNTFAPTKATSSPSSSPSIPGAATDDTICLYTLTASNWVAEGDYIKTSANVWENSGKATAIAKWQGDSTPGKYYIWFNWPSNNYYDTCTETTIGQIETCVLNGWMNAQGFKIQLGSCPPNYANGIEPNKDSNNVLFGNKTSFILLIIVVIQSLIIIIFIAVCITNKVRKKNLTNNNNNNNNNNNIKNNNDDKIAMKENITQHIQETNV